MMNIILDESFDKDINFIEFLNICLNLSELLFIAFFSSFESSSINQSYMSDLLIFSIDLVPFSLETITKLPDFLLREALSE